MRLRLFGLSKAFDPLNSLPEPRLCRIVEIQQCSLTWPVFGIKKTIFEGHTYSVTNTCSIDSSLFALYFIFRTERSIRDIILNTPNEPFSSLRETFVLVESDGWDQARLHWLTTHGLLNHEGANTNDIYGSLDTNAIRFIKNPLQLHQAKGFCARHTCPQRERTIKTTDIGVECWEISISKFEYEDTVPCTVFVKKLGDITYKDAFRLRYKRCRIQIINVDSNTMEYTEGWQCNEKVTVQPATFVHGQPPFLFVDTIHPIIEDPKTKRSSEVSLNIHDIPRYLTVGSST
ncbi:unnamed protein product [Rotaria sp. Silwood2]|nr:unnamed protein product [Rotaria sp. Silwood2]